VVEETISHYRMLGKLGGGGMGVVYRAEDLRLGREVALKFLPRHLADQRDALERFRQEARVASSLNHPHICTIYDIDEHDGHPFIVMEFLDGPMLKDLLAAGPLETGRVIRLAIQIVDALEAAHRRGIVHRDVKPANVFVSASDQVKVLDFGTAKLIRNWSAPAAVSKALTEPGITMGTLAYMSPEQARGDEIDARSDLFAFGSVLYEMATGKRAFDRAVPSALFDMLLNQEPVPPREVKRGLPPALEDVIRKCHVKERAKRYQEAGEVFADLRRIEQTLRIEDQATPSEAPAAPAPERRSARRPAAILWGAAALAAAVVVLLFWTGRKSPAPQVNRGSILVADFENRTDDPVFDGTLRQGLAVGLAQSPFVSIVSDERVRQTLALMGRSADERLTREAALEACRRQGAAAAVDGSIGRLGAAYVITLEATSCRTGETISRQQREVDKKEKLLRTLDRMSAEIRGALGESMSSIQRFDVPIEQVTTPSLEALQAFTLGQRQRARGREIESIPLYLRAIELDPDFASAYAGLSTIYSNLGDASRAREYAKKAYDRRGKVSERERLFLTYQYHYNVTGDQSRAREVLEVWRQSFPREFQPVNGLALSDNFLGRFERAVEEAREAVRRNPAHGFPYSNLAHAYRGLGRFDEARKTAELAVSLKIETLPTRRLLYQMAVSAGDQDTANRQIEWARGKPREFDMTGSEAQAAAFAGRVREARQLYEKTVRLTEEAKLPDVGTGYLAFLSWMELAYGDTRPAVADARRVLARGPSYDPRLRAALVLAATGSAAEAESLVADLQRSNPDHTFINFVLAPAVRAEIELSRGRPKQAIEQLRAAAPYETGFVAALAPIYLRARSYLALNSAREAEAEFQRILEHRGSDPFSGFCAVARLGIARARVMAGNQAGAREAYEKFLTEWSAADADVPVLVEARRESGRLREFTPTR